MWSSRMKLMFHWFYNSWCSLVLWPNGECLKIRKQLSDWGDPVTCMGIVLSFPKFFGSCKKWKLFQLYLSFDSVPIPTSKFLISFPRKIWSFFSLFSCRVALKYFLWLDHLSLLKAEEQGIEPVGWVSLWQVQMVGLLGEELLDFW